MLAQRLLVLAQRLLTRQLLEQIIAALAYFGAKFSFAGSLAEKSLFEARIERHGNSLLTLLALCVPAEGVEAVFETPLLAACIEALLALVLNNASSAITGTAFALTAKLIQAAGPETADRGIARFALGTSTSSSPGAQSVALITSFIDGGEGALRIVDSALEMRTPSSTAAESQFLDAIEALQVNL